MMMIINTNNYVDTKNLPMLLKNQKLNYLIIVVVITIRWVFVLIVIPTPLIVVPTPLIVVPTPLIVVPTPLIVVPTPLIIVIIHILTRK